MKKVSSEIQEASKIFGDLIAQSAVIAPAPDARKKPGRALQKTLSSHALSRKRPPVADTAVIEIEDSDQMYRGDRLENTLYAMCKRGGFVGSVLVDSGGLPLAVYNSPVEEQTIAAYTMVLGDALEKAGKILEQSDANTISMDINYIDKAVIRRFLIHDLPYFLMVICPQEVDERAEVELSIDKITSILKKV
ncbi:MAG: hypothetical protein GY795_30550 [Desulfobacterales bacterium]|nr:hypothetical protein [Desulfobacterales bacterium]